MNSTQSVTEISNFATTLTMLFFVLWILTAVCSVIGYWFMFKKAGEKGWKALIPFYSTYVMTKLTWHKKFFWIMLGVSAAQCILLFILPYFASNAASSFNAAAASALSNTSTLPYNASVETPLLIIFTLLILFVICGYVLNVISNFRISEAFGHEIGYTLGILFLPYVFLLIIGLGSSVYLGNYYEELKNRRQEIMSWFK